MEIKLSNVNKEKAAAEGEEEARKKVLKKHFKHSFPSSLVGSLAIADAPPILTGTAIDSCVISRER